jgi:hypothetical protein
MQRLDRGRIEIEVLMEAASRVVLCMIHERTDTDNIGGVRCAKKCIAQECRAETLPCHV